MSVSSFDTSAHASPRHDHDPTPSNTGAPASRHAPTAQPTLGGYGGYGGYGGNVNFHSQGSQTGPVFGNPQFPANAHPHAAHHFHGPNQGAALQTIFQQVSQILGQWFGGQRPQRPDTSIGNPYPPAPRNPDSRYTSQSNQELLGQLRDSFPAFQDPETRGFTSKRIYEIASEPLRGGRNTKHEIRLANELLRRPELLKSLDRSSTGTLDGMFNLTNLFSVLYDSNPFKFTTDKDLAGETLKHFAELRGGAYGQTLSFLQLKEIEKRQWSGNPTQDHVTQLAREVLRRREVLSAMDNSLSDSNDGSISRAGLLKLMS